MFCIIACDLIEAADLALIGLPGLALIAEDADATSLGGFFESAFSFYLASA